MLASVNFAVKQSGPLEDHDVLGNRVERNRERLGNLIDGGGMVGERLQDGAPGGIGERRENLVKLFIFNHSVEYYWYGAFLSKVS